MLTERLFALRPFCWRISRGSVDGQLLLMWRVETWDVDLDAAMVVAHSGDALAGRERGLPEWVPMAPVEMEGEAPWDRMPSVLWSERVATHLRSKDLANAMLTCAWLRRALVVAPLWETRAAMVVGRKEARRAFEKLGASMPARVVYHLCAVLPLEFTLLRKVDQRIRKDAWRGTVTQGKMLVGVLDGSFSLFSSSMFTNDYGDTGGKMALATGSLCVRCDENGPVLELHCKEGRVEDVENGEPYHTEMLHGSVFSWSVRGLALIMDKEHPGIPRKFVAASKRA